MYAACSARRLRRRPSPRRRTFSNLPKLEVAMERGYRVRRAPLGRPRFRTDSSCVLHAAARMMRNMRRIALALAAVGAVVLTGTAAAVLTPGPSVSNLATVCAVHD